METKVGSELVLIRTNLFDINVNGRWTTENFSYFKYVEFKFKVRKFTSNRIMHLYFSAEWSCGSSARCILDNRCVVFLYKVCTNLIVLSP